MERLFRIIPFIPLALVVISFWGEIGVLLGRFFRWLWSGDTAAPAELSTAMPVVLTISLSFLTLFFLWLLIVSFQTIFPVTGVWQAAIAALYLVFYLLGKHGLAAYVRNGRIKAFVEELDIRRPGVVLVDFNSAIAVEQIVLARGSLRNITSYLRGLTEFFGAKLPSNRIRGAGLTFLLPDERIYGVNDLFSYPVMTEDHSWMERILGVVDLRNQFRTSARQPHPLSKRLGTSVFAYTRDGIEVKTSISVQTTLGQEPIPYFPLNVAYIGDQHPRNLRSIKFKSLSERAGLYCVESLSNDLDQWDRLEIHEQWQTISSWVAYENAPRAPTTPFFSPARVFAAIYSRARHYRGLGGADEIIPWVDLPIHVAIDLFREIISQYNYDEIYFPVNGRLRIGEIRGKLSASMRNSGVLSWRPIVHRAGECFKEGGEYFARDLLTVPATAAFALQNSKVLRDRGIRVILSGFGDLTVDERIYKQRLDNWRANWDRETEIVEAGREWESMRVRTRARIQAQQDFVQSLSQIYQSAANSREILALRVLQALENAAADPKTRQLLPENTFSMLRSIHDWLLPQDIAYGQSS